MRFDDGKTGNVPRVDSVFPRPAMKPAVPASTALRGGVVTVAWVVLVLALVLTVAVRIRMLDLPLERDEGEYAYAGQLLLQGVPPYKEAYNMKLPGTYAAYAAIMAVFGETPSGIRLGLLLVNLLTAACVFLAGRRLLDVPSGALAAAGYLAMSVNPAMLALWAHATHFVAAAAAAGFVLLLRALDTGGRRDWFFSGLLFGLAFLMKQHGMFFALLGIGVQGWRLKQASEQDRRAEGLRLAVYLGGVIAPYLLTCVMLAWAGVFASFWFWTVTYARSYATMVPWRDGASLLHSTVIKLWALGMWFWLLAGIGLLALLMKAASTHARWLLGGLALMSVATVCPGILFREHYFITCLPAAALLAALLPRALDALVNTPRAAPLAALVVGAGVLWPFLAHREFYFHTPHERVMRELYSVCPFPESVEVGAYLREHAAPDDRVAVFGSEPQICFYARRRSATGFIYMYPLTEPQPHARAMQKAMAAEIERTQPAWVVVVETHDSWLAGRNPHNWILEWVNQFVADRYQLVGLARRGPDFSVNVEWLSRHGPGPEIPPSTLLVLRRVGPMPAAKP
jgi:4-amino-4-deoxy-L-arabinose transferase-like glycosyltransferase